MTKKFAAEYAGYVYDESENTWTSKEELKKKLQKVKLNSTAPLPAGGLPVFVEGNNAYIDTSDGHTAFMAISGMKKSICGFMPLIAMLARAGENLIITDPKGELYNRMSGHLETQGYTVRCLNFRNLDQDGYNVLEYPAITYRFKDKDKGSMLLSDIIDVLSSKQKAHSRIDPYWQDTATKFMYGTGIVMFECFDMDHINMLSWANLNTEEQVPSLKNVIASVKARNAAMTGLREVLSEPDKTLMSTTTTAGSFLVPCLKNEKLVRMLSKSTFSLGELCKPKTALFIITDDTTSVYDEIIGIIISQIQSFLLDRAYVMPEEKLATRVNFVMDEFASYVLPPSQMQNALATHRSRNIRYYLCVQSLSGLASRYEHYEALLLNCATTVFLGSTESAMLSHVSKQCGTTNITENGSEIPLAREFDLITLKKSWESKEAIYCNVSEGIRYFTNLPSIEAYGIKARAPIARHTVFPEVPVYTVKELITDINAGRAFLPFSEVKKAKGIKDVMSKEVERKYNLLFK